jgi:8-oxo-dGTP pyrophosphatase MutT (NUDIX family)
MENPWKIVGEQQIYDNPWIGVTEYDVINPSGGKGIYGKVHYKNLAIGVIPLDAEGYIWLVGQYRFVLNCYTWEIPEGGGDPSVPPVESARRELKEETGLEASEWTLLLEMHLSNSVGDEQAFVYLARGLHQGTAEPEETEQLVVRRVPFEEAYQMVERGEITDSISVAGILKIKVLSVSGQLKLKT